MLLLRGLFLKLDLEWKVKKTTQTPIAVRGIWAPVRGDPTDCSKHVNSARLHRDMRPLVEPHAVFINVLFGSLTPIFHY